MNRVWRTQLALLGGLGLAVLGVWRWNQGHAQLTAESDRLKRSQREAARWAQMADMAEKQRHALRGKLAKAESRTASVSKAIEGSGLSFSQRLKSDPRLQRAYEGMWRAKARYLYGALFHQLNLPADRQAKFEDNLIRREEQEMELQATLNAEGKTNYDATASTLLGQIYQEYQTAQQQILDSQSYAAYQTYERTAAVRSIVNGWAGAAVVVAGSPLTSTQTEALVQAMANASPTYQAGGEIKSADIDWNQVDAQAATFLSPAQLEVIQKTEPDAADGRFRRVWNAAVNRAIQADAGPRR